MIQFKAKDSNFWKWILWASTALFGVGIVWSINHMTPSLLTMAVIMGVAGTGASLVYCVYMTVNSPMLRRKAWASEGVIIGTLVLQLIIHMALSRRFDVATQARDAQYLEQDRQRQINKERADADLARMKEQSALMEKQSAMIEKQAALTRLQNRQLTLLDPSKRRQMAEAQAPSAPPTELQPVTSANETAATLAPLPTPKTASAAKDEILSPEQVQERAWWWVVLGIIGEALGIGGTAVYFGRGMTADRNNNGIPDWIEQLPPDELLAKYPEYYQMLYGEPAAQPQPKQRPGYTTAYAQYPQGPKE